MGRSRASEPVENVSGNEVVEELLQRPREPQSSGTKRPATAVGLTGNARKADSWSVRQEPSSRCCSLRVRTGRDTFLGKLSQSGRSHANCFLPLKSP